MNFRGTKYNRLQGSVKCVEHFRHGAPKFDKNMRFLFESSATVQRVEQILCRSSNQHKDNGFHPAGLNSS
ncbi:hypothetical protein HYC85_017612 [Camellia sinensis]|uniref:Uncharacterized protein n=1 Tax=Camellia sinensis TaxID=4442 RepID=A0A7J7GTL1_CAMSI|nr:hypothetical protein HYC85_017612 [Camellia sinensis]